MMEPVETCHLCHKEPTFTVNGEKVEARCHNGRDLVSNIDISHLKGERGTLEFVERAKGEAIRIWNLGERGEKAKLGTHKP